MYTHLSEIRAANERAGRYFFSKGATRFFKSKYYNYIYQGKYFIDSTQPPHGPKWYNVREALSSGHIKTISDHPTLIDARNVAKNL